MRHLICAVALGLSITGCEEQPASLFVDGGAPRDAGASGATGLRGEDGGKGAISRSMDASVSAKIDRSGLNDVGREPLDYADPALWACRPGNDPNECHANLDATEILKDGKTRVVKHERAEKPAFDCFYVYPTVDLTGGNNMTDFSDKGVKMVQDALLGQAARFNRVCEVYAPMYRQRTIKSLDDGGTEIKGDPALGIGDVQAAFKYYVEHLNKGRDFVLIGHSQGTAMLTSLIASTVDKDEKLRERFISGVLLGGGVSVEEGERLGGSFENVPVCTEPGDTGCVIAYVSFDRDAPPNPANARFGRAPMPTADGRRLEIACTQPALLNGNDGRYAGSYFSTTSNNPTFMTGGTLPEGIKTRYLLYRDMFRGECVNRGGFSYLQLSVERDEDDIRTPPGYRNMRLEGTGWGLHLVDFNPALDDLIETVTQQAAARKGAR